MIILRSPSAIHKETLRWPNLTAAVVAQGDVDERAQVADDAAGEGDPRWLAVEVGMDQQAASALLG
ncbi:hypothetical protein ACQPW1_13560 [Nocardia sp. CA-128927]|uniref:hypothetical protein n=1 Tax=Nocardia sp. CA-128927 TaxID=3239975 RepID=UPI003D97566C